MTKETADLHILLVDDSEMFRLMIARNMLNKGFAQHDQSTFSKGPLRVHVLAEFVPAHEMLHKDSEKHIDFSALFMDWHLSQADRAKGYDGVQLALMGCNDEHQSKRPAIYCISAENQEMRAKILAQLGPEVDRDRVEMIDFITVVDRILALESAF